MIKYTSYGAARQVTGSMHLFQIGDFNLLMDCGLDYEKDDNGFPRSNKHFDFDPVSIDALVLSHAHIDHSGNIPNLVRQGYAGPIYCTKATEMLVLDLWSDSLNIQKMDSRKEKNRKHGNTEVLYSERHIELARRQIKILNYRTKTQINTNVTIEFYQAGHIPGAASVKLTAMDGKKELTIGFSGDLGNFETALVKNPEPMQGLDYFLSESTYGGRFHTKEQNRTEVLLKHIEETCIKNRGKLVIPAFSVGRTQAIIFTIHQLYRAGKIPSWLNVYTDSPLAIRSTLVYEKCLADLNDEAQFFYQQHGELFRFDNLRTVDKPAQSDYISQSYEPCIIVSAAGMLEGGRIQKHIRNNIEIENNKILIAGYCSAGTLGAKLLEGQPTIRINKKEKNVFAKVEKTDVFSAHADMDGLLSYYANMGLNSLKKIYLVHGDEENMLKLKERISIEHPLVEVVLPIAGEENQLV